MKTLVLGFIFLFCQFAHAISKLEAYNHLKENGFKWRMTKSLPADAEAKFEESRSKFKPQVQLGFREFVARINPIQYGVDQQTINTVGFGTTALEMRWTFFDPLSTADELVAEAQLAISKNQMRQYQNDLTALMLVQYLTMQRLRRQLDSMEASVKRSETIFKLAKTKKDVGAGIPLDLSRAKTLLESDRARKIQVYTKYLKAQHDLAVTLGQEKIEGELEPLVFNHLSVTDFKSALNSAIQQRPDLKVAQSQVEASDRVLKKSQGIFFPKLYILGEVGTTNTGALGLPISGANGLIGINLEIPLETGGLLKAKREQAAAVSVKALLQEKQIKVEILNQLKEAIEQLLAAEEGVKVAAEFVDAAKEETRINQKRFDVGGANLLDYSASHMNLANALDTQTEAVYGYEAAKVNFFRVTGDFAPYFNSLKEPPQNGEKK